MKKFNITTEVEAVGFDELTETEQQLITAAREATSRSYAPYSKFHVGAAVLLDNGRIVTGSNQENVAYPSGTCAERTAAYYAHAQYPEARFETIAVAAHLAGSEADPEPVSPCGACRQALLQYELLAGRPVPVLLAGRDIIYRLPSVRSLIPFAFTSF